MITDKLEVAKMIIRCSQTLGITQTMSNGQSITAELLAVSHSLTELRNMLADLHRTIYQNHKHNPKFSHRTCQALDRLHHDGFDWNDMNERV